MNWPYHFVSLTEDEQNLRRELLDRYGTYAHLSNLVPVCLYLLFRLGRWISSERQRAKPEYSPVPGSPASKKYESTSHGTSHKQLRSLAWWLKGELFPGWGLRLHWIAGISWTLWLLFLCIHKTSIDYMHVTKRFGIVAAAQFRMHYLLSFKGVYSPLAFVFQVSHEELNPWHRISGRIIYFLFALHATGYMNFFIQSGLLSSAMTRRAPLLGVAAFSLFTILATTSLASARRWSYRVFFTLHLTIAFAIIPVLFFHAKPLRWFTLEAIILFTLDLLTRKFDTFQGFATLTQIKNTNLLKVIVPIPPTKSKRFNAIAGQHVYLSIPGASKPKGAPTFSIFNILHNPFTVAESTATDITLVMRVLHGPMTKTLKSLTALSKAKPPLNIEGPYGAPKHFPNFAQDFDRVLMVAGGIGSTFILPIFNSIISATPDEGVGSPNVELIWSMRSAAESEWVETSAVNITLLEDERVKLYLTGDADLLDGRPDPVDGTVEMTDLAKADSQTKLPRAINGRPDLGEAVDRTFRHGENERVAILVCGPASMDEELRDQVGRWVHKGRYVWYHNEAFGW